LWTVINALNVCTSSARIGCLYSWISLCCHSFGPHCPKPRGSTGTEQHHGRPQISLTPAKLNRQED
jgi:hypothetical protein